MNASRRGYQWASTISIPSAVSLGKAIGDRRRTLGISQRTLGARSDVEPSAISRLELEGDDAIPFGLVVRLVEALELDIELRPHGSSFVPRSPTKVNELGLSPGTMSAVTSAQIEHVSDLGTAKWLLALPEFSGGTELHEIVCALNRYGLSLPAGRARAPSDRDRELFRLRVVEGWTLDELAKHFDLRRERVRQLLSYCFGLTGIPPAVIRRRRQQVAPAAGWERPPGGADGRRVASCDQSRLDRLTPRQREVFERLRKRETDGAIALALHITPETVRNHTAQIRRKLEVGSKREILAWVSAELDT